MPLVGVVMGSASDKDLVQNTVDVLDQLGIENEVIVEKISLKEKAPPHLVLILPLSFYRPNALKELWSTVQIKQE